MGWGGVGWGGVGWGGVGWGGVGWGGVGVGGWGGVVCVCGIVASVSNYHPCDWGSSLCQCRSHKHYI